ncbi:hypothetical protein E5676_scaffold409G00580 [Cucumis melo var. makuwa]|uniref:Uncharacterized protein n=1 Tax=Cucumis melo var. makuwa TaxID=1194695 RepID=A0A5D3BXJ4_CUCMM|nr:hypothetical protein E5676_scaffold409G00580 [Cucumis melo var. makuwa]
MVRRKEREILGIGCGIPLCAVISPACEFARDTHKISGERVKEEEEVRRRRKTGAERSSGAPTEAVRVPGGGLG